MTRTMTQYGYTASCEQTPVRQLVSDLQAAEQAGFDFSVMSDHYFPWLEDQGHSGYAWAVLGAAAQATHRLPLMTMVTCPTFRYHPAVVAQKAATMGVLSGGRFTLGLGAGENLNEHVVGGGWPSPRVRHERLSEAIRIIRHLFTGEYVNFSGRHFEVERARDWYATGLGLLPMLDWRSAACTGAMAGIYRRLLERIAAQPAEVLRGRMSLSTGQKAAVAVKALAGRIG